MATIAVGLGSVLAGVAALVLLPLGSIVVQDGYKVLIYAIAVCVVGALAAFVGFSLGGIPPQNALMIAIACGVAGASVEAVSNHGLDNLTIQVAAAGTAFLLLT